MKLEQIKLGAKVKITNNPALAGNVYELAEVELLKRGIRLVMFRTDEAGTKHTRDERPENCEVVDG